MILLLLFVRKLYTNAHGCTNVTVEEHLYIVSVVGLSPLKMANKQIKLTYPKRGPYLLKLVDKIRVGSVAVQRNGRIG